MAGKGITFLAVLLLLHLTVDTGAVSPFVLNDRNITTTPAAAVVVEDEIIPSRPLLDSDVPTHSGDNLMQSTSSINEGEQTAAGPGSGWKTIVAIDSAQQGGLRRLDTDSNTPGVAVYIAVFVVAVVLFLVCLRACGVGAICIPISCC